MRAAAIIASLGIASSVGFPPAQAAQPGFYGGLFYGEGEKQDVDRSVFDQAAVAIYGIGRFVPQSSSATIDTKDAAYGFIIGYRLYEHFAVEGSYFDLGTVAYRDTSSGVFNGTSPQTWRQNIDSSTSGLTISALGILPLSYRWELYARAGALLANNEVDVFVQGESIVGELSDSKSGLDWIASFGTSFSVAEIYALRLEVQRVFAAGDDETLSEADVDLLTFGVMVSF